MECVGYNRKTSEPIVKKLWASSIFIGLIYTEKPGVHTMPMMLFSIFFGYIVNVCSGRLCLFLSAIPVKIKCFGIFAVVV